MVSFPCVLTFLRICDKQRAHLSAVQYVIYDFGIASVGDHCICALLRRKARGMDFRQHAACAEPAPCAARSSLDLLGQVRNVVIQHGIRIFMRIFGIIAVDIREDDQQIGRD